jgi:hypothetical protein
VLSGVLCASCLSLAWRAILCVFVVARQSLFRLESTIGIQSGEIEKTARIRIVPFCNPSVYLAAAADSMEWQQSIQGLQSEQMEVAGVRRTPVCMSQSAFVDGHAFRMLPVSEAEVMCVERLRSQRTFLCMVLDRFQRTGWQLPAPDFCLLLSKYLEDTVKFLNGENEPQPSLSFR